MEFRSPVAADAAATPSRRCARRCETSPTLADRARVAEEFHTFVVLFGIGCHPDSSTALSEAEVALAFDGGQTFSQSVHVDDLPTGGKSATDDGQDGTVVDAEIDSFDLGDPVFPSLEVGASTRSRTGDVPTTYADDGGIDQVEVDGILYEWHGTLTIASAEEAILEIALEDGMLTVAATEDCEETGGTLRSAYQDPSSSEEG